MSTIQYSQFTIKSPPVSGNFVVGLDPAAVSDDDKNIRIPVVDFALLNTSNTYIAGTRQNFLGLVGGTAGINVGAIAGNPTSQVNADIWYNSLTNQLFGRINGANVDLGGSGGDMILANIQTVTGAKTFGTIGGAVGKFILAGSTSGSTIVNAAAVAGSTTITFPGTTGTIALTSDLTGKFDTAGTGLTSSGTTVNAIGTSNRISVSTDAIDIASTYVGQSSITTLGTIGTGVWNATDIALANIVNGTANQIIKTNAGGTALEFGLIGDANTATFTTTKISTTNKSLLNSAIVYNDQINTFGDFVQTFKDNSIHIENPAGTFDVVLQTSAEVTADRILTIPLLGANRTMVVTGLSSQITIGTEVTGASTALSDTADIAYLNTDNTFLTNTKQTFTHQASKAGIALASVAGDVTSPNNGEYWYNATSNKFRARENGASVDMIGGGASTAIFATVMTTAFEDLARFLTITNGSGTVTINNNGGTQVDSNATATSSAQLRLNATGPNTVLNTIARHYMNVNDKIQGSDYNMYWGAGFLIVSGSSISYTRNHYGWKSIRTSSGTVVVSATNANGTTETATDIGITDEIGDYFIDKASSSSIKYYRQGTGETSYTLEATHTTNISTATDGTYCSVAVSNIDVASQSRIRVGSMSFQNQVVA